MAYLNYQVLYEKSLTENDFHILQKAFQKEELLLKAHLKRIKQLVKLELLTYLKGKENKAEGVRITKKGKSLLNQLEVPNYSEKNKLLADKLIEMYQTRQKFVGNNLEVFNRLNWFISQTGFNATAIYKATEEYLIENSEYTLSLENLIWKPQSKAFSVHKNLKESRLFDLICNKYNLNELVVIKSKDSKKMRWLKELSNLEPPKTGKAELYFTGEYNTDLEHIERIQKLYLKELKNV